jgi:hypothetical protein
LGLFIYLFILHFLQIVFFAFSRSVIKAHLNLKYP